MPIHYAITTPYYTVVYVTPMPYFHHFPDTVFIVCLYEIFAIVCRPLVLPFHYYFAVYATRFFIIRIVSLVFINVRHCIDPRHYLLLRLLIRCRLRLLLGFSFMSLGSFLFRHIFPCLFYLITTTTLFTTPFFYHTFINILHLSYITILRLPLIAAFVALIITTFRSSLRIVFADCFITVHFIFIIFPSFSYCLFAIFE